MAGHACDVCRSGRLREFFLHGFVAARNPEHHIHFGARILFYRAGIESARVDRIVEQVGFSFVSFFGCGYAAFGRHPLENQTHDVDRKGRRSVEERVFFDLGPILQERRQILIGALSQIAADDNHGDSGWP